MPNCAKFCKPLKLFDCMKTVGESKFAKYNYSSKSEVMFQQCARCNEASFSFIWRYFHEKRCTFGGSASNGNQKELILNKMTIKELSTKSGLEKWFACDQCEYTARKKDTLKKHKINKHVPDNLVNWFECDECNYKSKDRSALKRHQIYKHVAADAQEWFGCDKCRYKAKTERNLKTHKFYKHMPAHLQKWFACDECKYKTNNNGNLKKHRNRKHK